MILISIFQNYIQILTSFNILSIYRFSHSIQGIDFIAPSTQKPITLEEQKTMNRLMIAELRCLDPYQNQVNINLVLLNYNI